MTTGLAFFAASANGGQLEKLLMPGDLSRAHMDLEADCDKCHDNTDRSRQKQLCMDCHKDVAGDIASRDGFHGRAVARAECNACHSEHKGRKADILGFTPEAFDHTRSDFALDGAHASTTCAACHKAGKKFREAPGRCIDCHRDDDVHAGKLGSDCAQCHETARFAPATFDHSKTKFPLRNAHAKVACFACHRDPSFKGAPGRCVDCHASDDVHRGSRGPDCANCHGTVSWKETRFDHEKASGYALLGKHAKLACDTCHRGGDLKAPLPTECNGCHAATDPHSGRFGATCADCHTQDEWAVASFDHEKRAKFVLRGAHAELDCHSCHTGVLKQQQMAKDCAGCHGVDDVHKESMGRDCQLCHNEVGWRDKVKFDHDLTKFPLVGLHVGVPCEECHASKAFRDAPEQCFSCHRARDVHKGQLGEDCASCHNPNGWDFWQFDHGTATDFALTGAHERLGCRNCHQESAHDFSLSSECAACHRADDIHDGRFGRDCGRCHGTGSFRQLLTH
ncbi:MAG: cytochrome c3 family protein [Steroidobacteraceae bacterium]